MAGECGCECGGIKQYFKATVSYMILTGIIGMVLGLVMLFYPGGTMALMGAAFFALQVILSVFILAYSIGEAVHYFKYGRTAMGIIHLIIGIAAAALVWVFDVRIVYLIVAFFIIIEGVGEIIGGFTLDAGRYFFIFLGLVNILVGAMMIKYPFVLPVMMAFFVLFWGASRFFVSLELRKLMPKG